MRGGQLPRDKPFSVPGSRLDVLSFLAAILFAPPARPQAPAGVPGFKIIPVESKSRFHVDAAVAIEGTFDKWDATLSFTSADVSTGVLILRFKRTVWTREAV